MNSTYTVVVNVKEGKEMIGMKSVEKKLGGFQLEIPEIGIPEGYICGLVGPNGSGKTTLLNLLLGLYRCNKGEIVIDDMIYEEQRKEILDLFGTVLVEDLLRQDLSLIENADMYGSYYSRYDREYFLELLEQFGLAPMNKFGKLSKGQKLKAQFAFALSCHPKYLVLDEPTANFDPKFRKIFWEIIGKYVAEGDKSVILATHLTDDLDRMADYLIYLEKGKVIYHGDMEKFRESYRIVSGEKYKINLIQKDYIIHMEEHQYTTKALVVHKRLNSYDSLTVTKPSIEEFMYHYTKRSKRV